MIANQGRIEQVIVNFITNAIRYTPNKEDIIISAIDEKDRIKVCIENKGTHIEEEQLDKIWDRFIAWIQLVSVHKVGRDWGLLFLKIF